MLTANSDIRSFANYGGDFHSDHSFEANPPSYTILRLVRTPETGGDTIFTSQTALYDKLSPSFQTLFEGLKGVHSSEHGYVNSINRGSQPFRGPVRREHPLVRTHPVTRLKSLFYNPSFVIHLQGLKGAEALHTLNFLRESVPSVSLHGDCPLPGQPGSSPDSLPDTFTQQMILLSAGNGSRGVWLSGTIVSWPIAPFRADIIRRRGRGSGRRSTARSRSLTQRIA